jgi:hypothetical protein
VESQSSLETVEPNSLACVLHFKCILGSMYKMVIVSPVMTDVRDINRASSSMAIECTRRSFGDQRGVKPGYR